MKMDFPILRQESPNAALEWINSGLRDEELVPLAKDLSEILDTFDPGMDLNELEEFFDAHHMHIYCTIHENGKWMYDIISDVVPHELRWYNYETRTDAKVAAIKKAFTELEKILVSEKE